MKSQTSLTKIYKKIEEFSKDLGGVFTFANLCHLIGRGDDFKNRKILDRLLKEELLYPIGQRNRLYVTQAPNLKVLASKLEPQSYVTADVVLADGLLIGSIPGTLTCAYPGNKRKIFETPFGQVRFLSIKKELIFGVQAIKQGVRVADVEKAYLDLLYFYQKGSRFVCDPFQDIKVWKINQKKINQYLKTYTNPRFIKFVKNSLSENV